MKYFVVNRLNFILALDWLTDTHKTESKKPCFRNTNWNQGCSCVIELDKLESENNFGVITMTNDKISKGRLCHRAAIEFKPGVALLFKNGLAFLIHWSLRRSLPLQVDF